ncbi:hypothetical protein HAZT_HAZT000142 [Hyalella azteca]|uniref:BTB domain-containing protein n=1 Tax=Hyalella azteca TaxID=294128 RepID=A0A6A0HCG9_HYAAZ|nr:hypothetical protein HAZT_HAZT000142 [Hyalella azteca]
MSSSAAADMSSSSSESVPAPTSSEVMTTNRCSAGDTAVNPPKVAAPDSAMKSSAAPPAALPPTSGASVAAAAPLGNFLELQWTEHKDIFSQNIAKLRHKHMYTDATLACDGQFYPVHKFVLATCSEFFLAMFEWTPCVNPVLVLNNILTRDLEPILDFMYTGEMSVKECYLGHVIKAAQSLRVKGLAFPDESRPVMHKPPQPVANMNMACAGTPAGIAPQFPRPSLPSTSSADTKQNFGVNKREYEPSTKRIKSELDDSKQSVLISCCLHQKAMEGNSRSRYTVTLQEMHHRSTCYNSARKKSCCSINSNSKWSAASFSTSSSSRERFPVTNSSISKWDTYNNHHHTVNHIVQRNNMQ